MHFDLVDLRLFVHVADTNSLTRGAERSHLSVPAASVRIKNLEESVCAQLLWRSRQGVTLTPPGQALAHHARLVLAQLDELKIDLQEYAQGVKGHLRVFASTTAITEFLPAVLSRYLAAHRDVSIDLRERLSSDIVRAVSEGQTDIGIVAGTVRTEGLEALPYRQDRLVLVLPLDHPLAQHSTVRFADTLAYDHVGLHEGSAINAFLHRIAQEQHGGGLKLRIQVGGFEAACRMVEAGVGVAIVAASAAGRYREHMQVRVVELADDWALRKLQVVVRSVELLPGFARELIELLRADAEQG
jgi:DNA-binding transcriptional LysR family regulator